MTVVLPEPISPEITIMGASLVTPYSSMVSAMPCLRPRYKNAGSGVSEKGFSRKPKCFSYMVRVYRHSAGIPDSRSLGFFDDRVWR